MNLMPSNPIVWTLGQGEGWNTYNQLRPQGYPAFLSDEQKCRLERIRQGTMLFDGGHRQYFLEEGRTRFNFPEAEAQYSIIRPYSTFNLLGLISQKGTDLLFGQEPAISADNDIQQQKLDELVKRTHLYPLLRGAAVDATYQVEAFLEACIFQGKVYIVQVPAEEIFPVGEIQPDKQYASYVRFNIQNIGTDQVPIWLLLETHYLAGAIERHLYQLDKDGKKMPAELALDQWKMPSGSKPLSPITLTGIAANTITWIPNMMARGRAVSDYDGAIDLQDKLNAQDTQVDNILAKHAELMVAAPKEMADEDGNAKARHKLWWYDDPERIPKYIQRTLELDAPIGNVKRTVNNLLIRTETSPVLLGLKEGAAPDAYKKVRLEAFNSIVKASRKAAYWTPGVERALTVAQDLEQTIPGERYDRVPLSAQLRDGIPVDAFEQAQTQALLVPAGLQSTRDAVHERIQNPVKADEELAEIETDQAQKAAMAMPATLFGEPAARPQQQEQLNAA
jgi:hypothetical protein